jgi:hypothetical protein
LNFGAVVILGFEVLANAGIPVAIFDVAILAVLRPEGGVVERLC